MAVHCIAVFDKTGFVGGDFQLTVVSHYTCLQPESGLITAIVLGHQIIVCFSMTFCTGEI